MIPFIIVIAIICTLLGITAYRKNKQSKAYNKVWEAAEATVYRSYGGYEIPMLAKEALMWEKMSREEKRQVLLALKKAVKDGTHKLIQGKFYTK